MGKKSKKSKKADELKDKAKKGAHRVWLAGLGALAAAESEGEKLFQSLVAKGEELEQRGKPVASKLSKRAEKAKQAAEQKAAQVGADAKEAWDKVESLLEEKVHGALESRGYVARAEVDALHQKIDELKAQLAATKKPTRKPAKRAARKSAKKTAARKPAARKPAKKTARKPAARKPAAKKTTAEKTTG